MVFVVYDGEEVWLKESDETLESCRTLTLEPELGERLIGCVMTVMGVYGVSGSDFCGSLRTGIGWAGFLRRGILGQKV